MPYYCAQGVFARMYTKTGSGQQDFTSGADTYEFVRESLRKEGTIAFADGIRGTRSQPYERARKGPSYIGGSVHFNPDPAMLDKWLERSFGASPTGTDPLTFAVSEGLPTFGVLVDRVTRNFRYNDMMVNQMVIAGRKTAAGQQPDVINMSIEMYGKSRDQNVSGPSTAVDLNVSANAAPYIFEDATVTMLGVTREVFNVMVRVHNHLHIRTSNSLTPTMICPGGRTVDLQCSLPYTSNEVDLLDQNVTGSLSAQLKFTNGTMSLTLDFAALQVANDDPVVSGKSEITLSLHGIARSVGITATTGTREVVAINDKT